MLYDLLNKLSVPFVYSNYGMKALIFLRLNALLISV